MSYTVTYKLQTNDVAWILDGNSVKKGTCLQTIINVVPITPNTVATNISYLILLECNAGTATVLDANVYLTLEDAITALQSNMANYVCPSPSA
jgi:hypothetical protein